METDDENEGDQRSGETAVRKVGKGEKEKKTETVEVERSPTPSISRVEGLQQPERHLRTS
jgi:hypothetical protein